MPTRLASHLITCTSIGLAPRAHSATLAKQQVPALSHCAHCGTECFPSSFHAAAHRTAPHDMNGNKSASCSTGKYILPHESIPSASHPSQIIPTIKTRSKKSIHSHPKRHFFFVSMIHYDALSIFGHCTSRNTILVLSLCSP